MDNRERKRWRERLRQQRELREERDAINAEILRTCKPVRRLLKKMPDDEVLKIVWYYRGSSKPQKKNAKKHCKEMQKKLDKHFNGRVRIKKCFCEVWCGRSSLLHERSTLKRAKEYADRYSLPLVAYSLDRFVRAEDSEARTGQFIPLDWPDLKILKDYFGDTVIATLRSPIEDMRVTRGYASKSGQELTGNAGGRPKKAVPGEKKRLREKYAPVAYRLRRRKDSVTATKGPLDKTGQIKNSTRTWKTRLGSYFIYFANAWVHPPFDPPVPIRRASRLSQAVTDDV